MPTQKFKVKQDTSLDKISRLKTTGRSKLVESSTRGSVKDMQDASQVLLPSDGQQRREKLLKAGNRQLYVPVISKDGRPLMPTSNWRANELIEKGKALRRFKTGIFYIRLTGKTCRSVQPVACGIDTGSKREAFTVKSESHTYLNILSDAVTWVKDAVEVRRNMRRSRRFRNTPCRQNKSNKAKSPFPPSTKARWQSKLRIINILSKLYPITTYVVEDVAARTRKGQRKWNVSFSPLETGKHWFYDELRKLGNLETKQGYETKELRDAVGLIKCKSKMKVQFDTHNIDSWVLANWYVGGHTKPDNTNLMHLIPIRFHRRQLHRFQPKEGIRLPYGGTISLGLKKGSLVKHEKYGVVYIGGNKDNRLSLHSLETGTRLCQNAKTADITLLTYNTWRYNSFSSTI